MRAIYLYHALRLSDCFLASDGDTFRTGFRFCEKQNKWVGNPATCAEVRDLLISLKNKAAADGGAERHHSVAMKYEYLAQMISWSESVCPFNPESAPDDLTIEIRAFQTEHIRFRAFSSLAWTLWTRFAPVKNSHDFVL